MVSYSSTPFCLKSWSLSQEMWNIAFLWYELFCAALLLKCCWLKFQYITTSNKSSTVRHCFVKAIMWPEILLLLLRILKNQDFLLNFSYHHHHCELHHHYHQLHHHYHHQASHCLCPNKYFINKIERIFEYIWMRTLAIVPLSVFEKQFHAKNFRNIWIF